MWWRRIRRRRPTPDVPSTRPVDGNGAAARRAVVESRRALVRTRREVDEWTGEIQRILGGQ